MNELAKWTLLIQVAATLFMVGLIWFVQIVHYPLFSRVGDEAFQQYEVDHQRLTTWVVGPPMLAEFATAVLLIWYRPTGIGAGPIWFGLAVLASIWLVTFFVQVPQHGALTSAYDANTARNLVLGNWYRTVAWTVRGVLVLWMLGTLLSRTISET